MLGYKMSTPKTSFRKSPKWADELTQDHSQSRLPKSPSGNKSTEIGEHSVSYREPLNYRIETAKKTINEVISELRDKRQMNEEALREVHGVNSQIIDSFKNHLQGTKRLSNSAINHYPAQPAVSEFENVDPTHQNLILRQRLNEQIRRNNELLARISLLEQENSYLKQSRSENQVEAVWSQNQMLRAQLAQCVSIPRQLLQEMQNLKRQNNELRGDTIALLQRQRI